METINRLKLRWGIGPSATVDLVILNTALFFAVLILSWIPFVNELLPLLYLKPAWNDFLWQPWSLFTYIFMHAGFFHLLGNMLFLLVFGLPTERALGSWRLLALFVAGGALSNFVAALSMDRPDRVIIGASGAVSTLIGAYLALFPNARLGVVLPLGLWLEFVRMPAVALISLWVVLQLLFTWAGPSFGAVAWWAHLAGFAFGFLVALAVRQSLARRSRLRA